MIVVGLFLVVRICLGLTFIVSGKNVAPGLTFKVSGIKVAVAGFYYRQMTVIVTGVMIFVVVVVVENC